MRSREDGSGFHSHSERSASSRASAPGDDMPAEGPEGAGAPRAASGAAAAAGAAAVSVLVRAAVSEAMMVGPNKVAEVAAAFGYFGTAGAFKWVPRPSLFTPLLIKNIKDESGSMKTGMWKLQALMHIPLAALSLYKAFGPKDE